jgi:hypothetical protein
LGLSLSRSIILDHDGNINVESKLGHGANFVIELPLIYAYPSEIKSTTPLTETRNSQRRMEKYLWSMTKLVSAYS